MNFRGRKSSLVIQALGVMILVFLSGISLINFFFIVQIIDRKVFISFLESSVALDRQIARPLNTLLIFQSLLAVALMAVYSFLKRSKKHPLSLFNGASYLVCFLLLFISFLFYRQSYYQIGMYAEDRIFEYLTAIFFLAGSGVFFSLIFKHWERDKKYRVTLFLLFAFFFFLGMEEISWAQRILGFKTPEFVESVNLRKETNLHNFLDAPYDDIIYYCFYLFIAAIFIFRDRLEQNILTKRKRLKWIIPLLPNPDLYYFGFMLIAMLILYHYFIVWEAFEEVFSVMGLAYALNVCFGNRSKTISVATAHAGGSDED